MNVNKRMRKWWPKHGGHFYDSVFYNIIFFFSFFFFRNKLKKNNRKAIEVKNKDINYKKKHEE